VPSQGLSRIRTTPTRNSCRTAIFVPGGKAAKSAAGVTIPLVGESHALQQRGETTVDAACRLAFNLDVHVLAIQGPPGTGKTYTGAHIICALKKAGLKVGVTAVSHKVIENLLEGAMEEAQKQGISLRAVHCQGGDYEGDWGIERNKDYGAISQGLENGKGRLRA
jgi:hypothetical protein